MSLFKFNKDLPFDLLPERNTFILFQNKSLKFHFEPERNLPENFNPNLPNHGASLQSGEYNTGKYHLIFKLVAPESVTGISDDSEDVFQEWELIKCVKFPEKSGDGAYLFRAWGRTPCSLNNFNDTSHHEGAEIWIDREFLDLNIIASIYQNFNCEDKLQNTIGLESLSFK